MAIKEHRLRGRHKHTAVAILESEAEAVRAVRELHSIGFTNEQLTLLAKDFQAVETVADQVGAVPIREVGPADDLAEEIEPKGRDEMIGMVAGAVVGFVAGLLMLAIPGFGTFLMQAGPLAIAMHCLTTAAAGLGLGVLLGAINDERVTEDHRDYYHHRLDAGHWILVVDGSDAEIERATTQLKGVAPNRVEAY